MVDPTIKNEEEAQRLVDGTKITKIPGIKKFYKKVEYREKDGNFSILLDGRELKTPLKNPLMIPNKTLAEYVVKEWQEQKEFIEPTSMHIMQYLSTSIDKIDDKKDEILQTILTYAETDLLVYRAEIPALNKIEMENWQPILDWAEQEHGIKFYVTDGLMFIEQPKESFTKLETYTKSLSTLELTAFIFAVQLAGSVMLGFALMHRYITIETYIKCVTLSERYQEEKWGEDEDLTLKVNSFEEEAKMLDLFIENL